MKPLIIFTFLSFTLITWSCKKDSNTPSTTVETLNMGSGYANDVYFSAANGIVSSVPRNTWDIGFQTNIFSATIITNGSSGIKLFTYPSGDTSSWKSVSISNVANWAPMNNSDTTWTFGAFEKNTLHGWDYGWSVYNQQTHELVGDSLFIIQLQDNSYKKLWIKKKVSTLNKYIFTFANIDGTESHTDTVDCSLYTKKNFIYFSLSTNKVVDREPDSETWDFVATRYITKIPTGPTTFMDYTVTGILTNNITVVNNINNTITHTGSLAAKMVNVNIDSASYPTPVFKSSISTIGYDWKVNVAQTAQYTISPRTVYFIKNRDNKIFKIVFTAFDSSTGLITLNQSAFN